MRGYPVGPGPRAPRIGNGPVMHWSYWSMRRAGRVLRNKHAPADERAMAAKAVGHHLREAREAAAFRDRLEIRKREDNPWIDEGPTAEDLRDLLKELWQSA